MLLSGRGQYHRAVAVDRYDSSRACTQAIHPLPRGGTDLIYRGAPEKPVANLFST